MTEIAKEFWEISLSRLSAEEMNAFRAAMETGAHARGLRLRPGVTIENVRAALPDAYEPIPWARGAYYIASESRAGAHPLHAAGAYYLQEPSAMAAVAALDVRPGQRVLDLCAAPGGKSTQIAGLLEGCGVLVCNEIVPSRAKILSQNIERMGVANAAVTNEAPPKLAARFARLFDRVLVDAPCSGEGMFRREEAARAEWRPDSPADCSSILPARLTKWKTSRMCARFLRRATILKPKIFRCPAWARPKTAACSSGRIGCAARDILWRVCAAKENLKPKRRKEIAFPFPNCCPVSTREFPAGSFVRAICSGRGRSVCRKCTACARCERACAWGKCAGSCSFPTMRWRWRCRATSAPPQIWTEKPRKRTYAANRCPLPREPARAGCARGIWACRWAGQNAPTAS